MKRRLAYYTNKQARPIPDFKVFVQYNFYFLIA